MAISIKCAGCQAAFDVPETLDGKTIRCTSCKTQLVVAAKKPASPLPPVRSKPVIEVEDDEEKTRPSRSTGSKGGKLSPRRRDDDEDDDDEEEEEDERPRKGKKKPAPKGGNGARIAIFGGLGVLVCGGLAAAIYFATASDDKKKETGSDTAANSNTSAPPMPMGKSGSGNSAVPANWKVTNADGFSFAMPGEPKIESVPADGTTIKAYIYEYPKDEGGIIVTVTSLKQKRGYNSATVDRVKYLSDAISNNAALMGANFRSRKKTAFEGHPAEDFVIDNLKEKVVMTGKGILASDVLMIAMCGHDKDPSFQANDGAKFFASIKVPSSGSPSNTAIASNIPNNPTMPGPMGYNPNPTVPGPMGTFPGPMGGPNNFPGPKGPGSKGPRPMGVPGPMGKFPGPMGVPGPMGNFPGPMSAPGPMGIPQPMGVPGPMGTFPGPMGVPPSNTFPPGPMGVPPQNNNFPSGPMNGFGPPGLPSRVPGSETVRPPLAARIEAFNAIAVDADRGDAYTVSTRKDSKAYSKVLGTLTRYSYPDFKRQAAFNLPFAATRAVLDSSSGKLYLATVTARAFAVERAGSDRVHGTGDIQIYDLAPIRDGKAEPDSNLKPLATIAQGAEINGLELSNDGKFLYVAVTKSSDKPRSHIKKYDLGDRKLVKSVPLPADAYEMQKSADGKKLFVIEHLRNSKAKNLQIMSCDLETMKVDSFRAPGIALDIASAPDDTLVISVEKPVAPAANFNGGGNGFGNPGGGGNGFGPPRNGQFGNLGGGRRGGGRGGPQPGGIYGQPGSGVNQPPAQPGGAIYGQASGNLGNGNQNPVLPPLEGELHTITADRSNTQFSMAWTASHNYYVRFGPDGEHLFVSSFNDNNKELVHPGLDIYVPDKKGFKKKASITKAIRGQANVPIGGYFHVTPDGKHLVFYTGTVLAIDGIEKNAKGAEAIPDPDQPIAGNNGPMNGFGQSNGFGPNGFNGGPNRPLSGSQPPNGPGPGSNGVPPPNRPLSGSQPPNGPGPGSNGVPPPNRPLSGTQPPQGPGPGSTPGAIPPPMAPQGPGSTPGAIPPKRP